MHLRLLLFFGLTLAACSDPTETVVEGDGSAATPNAGGASGAPTGDAAGAPAAGGSGGGGSTAADQATLSKTEGAVKVKGTIVVPGYEKGQIQVDVHGPAADRSKGDPPLTVVRVPAPGDFEIFLPPGTASVKLSAILDYEGNGPDSTDINLEYPGNPVDTSSGTAAVTITINRDTTPGADTTTTTGTTPTGTGATDGTAQPAAGTATPAEGTVPTAPAEATPAEPIPG